MVTNQVNDIRDRDRLTVRLIEMRRHTLQQYERVIVDQDDLLLALVRRATSA